MDQCRQRRPDYDAEDGLGFYADCTSARRAFADPGLIRRRPYRDIISDYLREDGISPVSIRRLVAEAGPDAADLVFQKLLRKPGSSGDAMARPCSASTRPTGMTTRRCPG